MSDAVSDDLDRFLERCRQAVDDRLDQHVPPLGTQPAILHEAMRYTLLAPGKRLRGAVLLAVVEMLRGDVDAAVDVAAAIEMVHAASLILDDLPSMDDASLRRGRESSHRRFGEANAILAAIGLLNLGYGTVSGCRALTDRTRGEIVSGLSSAIGAEGLVGGQVADLEATGTNLELDSLEFIHRNKTGALFIVSAEAGAWVAGGGRRDREALHAYAKNLGLAFQITDDLLDFSGDPAATGKDAGLDRGKTTFVDLCGIEGARKLTDQLIDTAILNLKSLGRRSHRLAALAEAVRGRDR
ncbi:MAG: polyprenyl synthetase family protein [Acidobacteriota bacterium]|nr:polyprenyl synthetase family protein [Acidobacteriota bacterium]MDH3786420.1 polyprenyl synthetase family protein [Acidobacteriota bacterium]